MQTEHYTKQTKIRQQVPLCLKDTIDSKKITEEKSDLSVTRNQFNSVLSPHVMSARGIKPLNETGLTNKNPIETLMSGTVELTPLHNYLRSSTKQQPFVTVKNYEKAI
jgi:hypothetical protein